ncbi:hypothetical protein ACVWY0_003583 [Arthrobacter sp. UYNi723]
MEVTLTVEADDGSISHLSATADSYEEARIAAEAKIPEGSQAIVIRSAQQEG